MAEQTYSQKAIDLVILIGWLHGFACGMYFFYYNVLTHTLSGENPPKQFLLPPLSLR